METHDQLLSRIEKALGPAAATMFIEQDADRHLIPELTFAGVALYVLGKYLDGFIEGLGVKELGKKHGEMVVEAIRFAGVALKAGRESDSEKLVPHAEAMSQTIRALQDYRSNSQALASGFAELRLVLVDQGIPDAEAERISESIVETVWQE